MKSKIILLMLFVALGFGLSAQPLNWREDSPVEFAPLTLKPDFEKFSDGSVSLKITFTETGTPYFVSDTFDITASTDYSFSIDVLDNDPGAEINQRIRFINADGTGSNATSGVFSADNAEFQALTFTGTSPATAVKAYVIIRIYDVAASWTGSGTFNVDNASFTEGGGTTNLIANWSFEEWNTPVIPVGSTLLSWREDSPVEFAPMTIVPEFEAVSHGFTSAMITFTETGTPYFVSDTFDITASTDYSFSIDVLDNDPGAEINQRIRFINADGTGSNATSGVFSADNAEFQTLTFTGTSPATAVKAYVIIRIYDVTASWTGSGTFHIDNASFTEGGGTTNLIANWSFEEWTPPTNLPEILSYSFEGLSPAINGTIDKVNHTVALTVPYATDVTTLVATFTLTEGATAKVEEVDQVSGETANDFTTALTYSLTAADGVTTQDWVITVSKVPASTAKQIISFAFAALDPAVYGTINHDEGTVLLEVPTSTNVTALVPTISVSALATVSPLSGVAQNFTAPVTYTVTAQDGSTKEYVVTVEQTTTSILFQEYFEGVPRVIPAGFTLIENDGYTPNTGDVRWADSAWVVTTSSRPEWTGNTMAVSLSYYTDMPEGGRADDWMILPSITVGINSTLSWKAMSLTSSGNYPDSYRVIAAPSSTVEQPTVSYFEENGIILQTINNESWSAAVGNPGQGISERSINLKDNGYVSQPIWIAFVLITGNGGGSYLAIDDIKVIEGQGTGINDNLTQTLAVNIYPNPTSGSFSLLLNADRFAVASIDIVDLVGRVVYTRKAEVTLGENTIVLNAADLNHGMYLVRTRINGKENVTKLIVK
jgi:hypothetical protein